MTTARKASETHMTWRRSQRSTSAPATRLKSSHGAKPATLTSETAIALCVTDAASSGIAVKRTPSPSVLIVDATQTRQYAEPKPRAGGGVPSEGKVAVSESATP